MKDYIKFKDTRTGLVYIAGGTDFKNACDKANRQTPKEYRQFVASLIQTPLHTLAACDFFNHTDVIF